MHDEARLPDPGRPAPDSGGPDRLGPGGEGEYAGLIVDTIREGLLVLTRDLRVKSANQSFYDTFGVRPEETVGRLVYDLGNGQWDIPALRRLLEDVLPHNEAFGDYEVEHEFEGLGRRCMLLNARRLNHHDLILLAIEDVTERRRSERELRASEERFRLLVENATEYAIFAMDEGRRITLWSPGAERVLGWSQEEVLGRPGALIFTAEDRAAGVPDQEIERALTEGSALDERWHVRKDGSRFWASGVMVALREEDRVRGFAKILRDNTRRKEVEEALRESEARYRTLFDSIDEGFCVIEMILGADGEPTDYRWLEANPAFERHTGLEGPVGRTARELVPGLEEHWVEIYGRVARTGERERFVEESAAMGRWFEVDAFRVGGPESRRVALLFTDVTERKRAEDALRRSAERGAFRVALADALRPVSDPAEVQAVACRMLGRHLGASRVFYSEIEGDAEVVVVERDYTDGVPSVTGSHRLDRFGKSLAAAFRAGHTHIGADVVADPALSAEEQAAYAEIGVRAYVGVPLVKDGRLAAMLGVHQAAPRAWTPEEVALVEEVAERVWADVGRARAESALRRLNETLEARVTERTKQVRALASTLTRAEQEERRRIAHVLHDDLQQRLYGIQLKTYFARQAMDAGDAGRLREHVAEAEAWLREAIEVTRRLAVDLSPPVLKDEGLTDALGWLVTQMKQMYGLDVTVKADETHRLPDEDLRVLLFQIVRELLFNVVKHAGADRATVELAGDDGRLLIRVADEGGGFDVAEAAARSRLDEGLGLFSARERLALFHGRMAVASAPGAGTRVTIEVPLPPAPDA